MGIIQKTTTAHSTAQQKQGLQLFFYNKHIKASK